MPNLKQTFVTAFALFSLFFGAGNLIFPPLLGLKAGDQWIWVTLGFALSAVVIPILALFGHSRLQGTMADFGRPISRTFGIVYSFMVYLIALALPSPRTASVTYEMSVAPNFDWSPLWLSSVYFLLVFFFVLNRSKILEIIGKYLTPLIIVLLLAIITLGLFADTGAVQPSVFAHNFSTGILEGYQTFDALGGVVVGGIVVISLGLAGDLDYTQKRKTLSRAALMAGSGLLIIYGGLIALGANFSNRIQTEDRTELVHFLSEQTLGKFGQTSLGVLVALACFTTAVGIITGAADFMKGLFGQKQSAFVITAFVGCLLGVVIGQFNVPYIVEVAIPALMFIYPLTITLIILNIAPGKWTSKLTFRLVVATTLLFSFPDFYKIVAPDSGLNDLMSGLPLYNQNMAWVLPSLLVYLLSNFISGSVKNRQAKVEN
ncbi:branched-chain amino acid transport system II carrier protein [Aureitalea marina]|uniref:Branched-chain amino acid transport system II carrier protein n=1 Tax=Aureitalea marina TaxID=930804 RepID=A0A2S7KSN0_9FLAO|nr:branched-chain amino acid transport system II carrier protein [Aureitalea marina]PQB05639.1 branched-chain amino acid transport system II carrier protein [Aureitalea marina]